MTSDTRELLEQQSCVPVREFTDVRRVAVLCDFLEERWPSMDLVADMVCRHLDSARGSNLRVTQFRPALRRRFARFRPFPAKLAWNADRLLNRFADYPARLRSERARFDLFHLIDHSYSQLLHCLPAGRTVVTCHDLDTFRCVLDPATEPRPRGFRVMTQRILDGFVKAAHVIAVSSTTRDAVVAHGLFPPDRITVVPNGLHPAYSGAPDETADAAAARLLPRGESTTLLLNVGSIQARKRLDVLLRVFAAIRRENPDARLIRVGGGFTAQQLELAAELKVKNAIVVLPFLEPEILAAVYRRADLLLHTAEAEGFGLPLIEAMGCGCPVVASDIPVLREVGAQAAMYCPVDAVEVWKEQVLLLLEEKRRDSAAWQFRRDLALAHAARFSWVENARRTADIYRKVLNTHE